ncbi:uncharacterized protein LOC129763461 [Toxorhynchites rutilus septentrionalis]|uniref:uncharacterized protein LOC129763461 n=1 Tax=Toxorhynchites rutilus septentrionalis TaxID=329112 RepID=UPI0024799C57|nr:uncharacterized protein LOC129763461 [Toxorhynchites rutilus septentrionalis]
MRNCFIPHCDALHKANPKRAMFNVPMKNPQIFELWQEVLPKHRPLKPFDRICQYHFREEDILHYWEYNINGRVERMLRNKPTLRPNAVPTVVDLGVQMLETQGSPVKQGVKRKRSQKIMKKIVYKVAKADNIPEGHTVELTVQENALHGITNQDSSKDTEVFEYPVQTINDTIGGLHHNIVIETTPIPHSDFETLFDEVYEVQLPSTLWGVHRDAEKTFISFTEFSKDTMNIRKYLYVDHYLQYRMAVGQRIMRSGELSSASAEAITRLLDVLDKIKIRKVIIKGSSSILNES